MNVSVCQSFGVLAFADVSFEGGVLERDFEVVRNCGLIWCSFPVSLDIIKTNNN